MSQGEAPVIVHPCTQAARFQLVEDKINELIADKKKQDKERAERLAAKAIADKATDEKLDNIALQLSDLITLNNEIKDLKTTWKVAKNLGLGLAAVITVLGVIFGGIIAVKEWIKH